MKKIFLLPLIGLSSVLFSQKKSNSESISIERSVTGIQIGFLGLDIYNEVRLAEEWALRSQATLNPSIWGGDLYSQNSFALSPSISLAPKYYYNIKKRAVNGKNISKNSANYISLKLEYFPDWFVISNNKNLMVNNAIYLIPNYGFRRNFATNFNYEFRVGLGVGKIFKTGYATKVIPDLSFKIGYDF